MKKKFIFLIALFHFTAFAQVKIDQILEDKQDMSDAYYGTFKYKGSPYTGTGIDFHDNGKIKTLRNFKDGKYHGLWTEWYSNGNRKFEGNRVENLADGLTRWWYENGQLKKQATYEKDIEHGVIVRWHDNGHLKQIRHFNEGKTYGGWTTFDTEGNVLDEGDELHQYYRPFFGENVAPQGFEETSPSLTSDGKTIVFARYSDWVKKVPYIAYLKNGKWEKEQLSIVDTIYNLAISPNGKRIVFATYDEVENEEIRKAYYADKQGQGWNEPIEIKNLTNINAGYFQIMEDGSIYFFARIPKNGIYYVEPKGKKGYSDPKWLSDAVGLPNSDSFDAFLNPQKNKLIVSQAYSEKKFPERGEIGLYYYEKVNGNWIRKKRLSLGYAWGVDITSDKKMLFVRNGNIQSINLENMGISW
ncbi:MAG: hypothetical protein EX254_06695 [Flavobacteriaceae bacterium]|nr:MAG: hypothetical protein EX254_06695 [Flavobacteriaceae bacterium]